MSTDNATVTKQPFKFFEIPINKFNDEVIPHHQKIFETHKSIVLKLISTNDLIGAQREIKGKKLNMKQLKDLMYELDSLRAQVEDYALDKFDSKTLSLRKLILNLMTGYTDLENTVCTLMLNQHENDELVVEDRDPFEDVTKIQTQQDWREIKLMQRQEILDQVEELNRDVEDLREAYAQLGKMVGEQAETVDQVEKNVEHAQGNVDTGLRSLIDANKYKVVKYSVAGAVLGGLVGGPIGLLAGVKVGGLAALGCAAVGYTGGRFLKKAHDAQTANETLAIEPPNNAEQQKKDI